MNGIGDGVYINPEVGILSTNGDGRIATYSSRTVWDCVNTGTSSDEFKKIINLKSTETLLKVFTPEEILIMKRGELSSEEEGKLKMIDSLLQ